jgi:type I restriction enzyme S subunit
MDKKAPQGTQKNINIEFLSPWPIPVSPLEEQLEIVNILDHMTLKITALEKEIALQEELFRALLEELMSGRLSALPLVE